MQHFISSYGYLAILILMPAEAACMPVPSELTMPLGGAMAAGAVAGTEADAGERPVSASEQRKAG